MNTEKFCVYLLHIKTSPDLKGELISDTRSELLVNKKIKESLKNLIE